MGRIVTGPKSEAGQRTVSLPRVVVEALEKAPRELRTAWRGRRAVHEPSRRGDHAGPALEGVASGPYGSGRARGVPNPRLAPPRGHVDGPHARNHDEGADGPHRPRLARAALIYQYATGQRDHEIAAYLDQAI